MQKIEIPLITPHRAMQRRAAFLFSLAGALIFLSTLGDRVALPLQLIGAGIAGLALWQLIAALRVRAWSDFRIVLDDGSVEIPDQPLVRREMVRIPMGEIQMVSYAAADRVPRLEILSRDRLSLVPFAWFPKGTSPSDFGLRVHVRSQLARAGQSLASAELAALEATMLAGKSYGAFVIERLGEPPEVVATLDAPSEKDAVLRELKGKGAKLYDCSERIRSLRDALERGLAAPFPARQKEKSE